MMRTSTTLSTLLAVTALLLSSTPSRPVASGAGVGLSPPQGGKARVTTEDVAGLRRFIFDTERGDRIYVNLPGRVAAGDTVSGSVFIEAAGKTEAERAANLRRLKDQTVEIAGLKLPLAGGTFELKIPARKPPGAVAVVLRDEKGEESARAGFAVAPQPLPPVTGVRLPAYSSGKGGGFLEIACPCDGRISAGDYVRVAGHNVHVLAEFPTGIVAFYAGDARGLTEIEFSERGQVTKGRTSILGIRLSAPKLHLEKGEQTTLTVEVTGLEGVQEVIPLLLENRTAGVLTMEPANAQSLTINPSDVQPGGKYTIRRTLTGIRVGTFAIEGTVVKRDETAASPPGQSASWREAPGTGRDAITPTPTPAPTPAEQRPPGLNRRRADEPANTPTVATATPPPTPTPRPTPSPAPQPCNPGTNYLKNGGFEAGLNDWTFVYGTAGKKIDDSVLPTGHPPPTLITAGSPLLPQQGKKIAPYCGTQMLRINDLKGGTHATRVSQKITVGDISPCSRLQITWGAMLEQSATHGSKTSTKFEIEITNKGGKLRREKTVYTFTADALDGSSGGWVDIRAPGHTQPIWYKTTTFTKYVSEFAEKGDEIKIILTARDCTATVHGGAAFLDCVELIDPCTGTCPTPNQSPIPPPVVPNVFTPNGDGVNDVWALSNVHNACSFHADFFNRWGDRVASTNAYHMTGTEGGSVKLWDGLNDSSPVPEGTYYYVLTLKNCRETREFKGFLELFRNPRYNLPCAAAEVVSDSVEAKLQASAKSKARRNWRGKVRTKYGNAYAKWRRAKDKNISCHQSGKRLKKKWHCVARGRPCKK